LILTAPTPAPNLGRAVDLSARMIDSYLLTCQYSTAPPHLASFWLHGMFLLDTPDSSHMIISACSLARRSLLEKIHALTDIPLRVRNIVGRELAHCARRMASTTPHHAPCPTPRHASPIRSHSSSYRTLARPLGGPPGHSHLLRSGRPVTPTRFTPA
jgi:hypothetical protein